MLPRLLVASIPTPRKLKLLLTLDEREVIQTTTLLRGKSRNSRFDERMCAVLNRSFFLFELS